VAPVPEPLRLSVAPAQIGSGVAVADTAVGAVAVTATEVAATVVVPHTFVADNVYTPASEVAMLGRVVFWVAAAKLLGPIQDHDVAPVPEPVRVSVEPAHIGFGVALALTAVGAVEVTTTELVVPKADIHPLLSVTVTLYTPVCAVVTLERFGF
jgi:hypothetical protein